MANPYLKRPSNLLFWIPTLAYFVLWFKTGSFLLSASVAVAMMVLIPACIWKHDFGTIAFWRDIDWKNKL